jgi:hypothetical protein
MRLFIDCEFNGYKGQLLSLALVSEDAVHEFYETLPIYEKIDPWVKEHVIPHLKKPPITQEEFQQKLGVFLRLFPSVHIKADYPADLKYFTDVIETGPGEWLMIQPLTMSIDDDLTAKGSVIPHNALEDARALQRSWLKLQ